MANILKRASFLIKNILFMFFFYLLGKFSPLFVCNSLQKDPLQTYKTPPVKLSRTAFISIFAQKQSYAECSGQKGLI